MKPADRFRVLETLHCLAQEHVRVSVQRGALMLMPFRGGEVSAYARSLCRELAEAYEDETREVAEMIAGRRAA